MRRFSRPKIISTVLIVSIAILAGYTLRPTRAQETPAAPAVAAPTEIVDQVMNLISQGRSDDAISLMEGLKSQPELRQEVREKLARLHTDNGIYRGYDVAATQRFTNQFQTVDVLAYYDLQPVLLSFHFYRPQLQDNAKWNVLGLKVITALPEIHEVLKDTPMDYVGRKK